MFESHLNQVGRRRIAFLSDLDIFQDEVLLVELTNNFLFMMDQFGNVEQVFCSFVRGAGEKAMKVWDKGGADFYL